MKILLIGHSVEDHLNDNGVEKITPGGIYYSALALSHLKKIEDEFYLCTSISAKTNYLFSHVYKHFNQKYLHTAVDIPRIHLSVYDDKEREERYENITAPLILPDSFISFDAVFINMITGFDTSPEKLFKLKENYKGIIYLDVHSLSRGLDEKLKRDFRVIPNFADWNRSADIIQCNENELKTLYGLNEYETAAEVLQHSQALIITKGKTGARIYYHNEKEIVSIFISSIKIKQLNQIGCGDIFGASFIYNYLQQKNLIKALKAANITAGKAASIADLHNQEINLL